ncbi:leukosialin isoform X2 [Carettochelys insculpta]|uniref:leukosialin isoform X2 n=1 Tax=Carettochelys insculpta TaxID=44489 RepID=UPI003EBA84B3
MLAQASAPGCAPRPTPHPSLPAGPSSSHKAGHCPSSTSPIPGVPAVLHVLLLSTGTRPGSPDTMAALGTQPHSKALAVLLFLLVTTASAALLPESEHTTLGAKTEFDLSAFNIAANEPPSANVTANVSGPPPTSPIITSGALADLDTHPPTLAQLAHITPSLSAMESEASSASPPDLHSTKITLGSPKAALGQGPGQTTVPEGSKKPSVEPEIQLAGPKESRGQENQTVPGRRELSSTASIHPFKVGGTDWSGEKHPIPASTSWTVPASTDRTIPASTDHSIPASTDHSIPTSADWTVPPPTILTTQGWLTPKATPAFTPTSKEKPDSKVTYSELPTPSPSPAATTHSIAVSIIVAIVTAVLLVLCLCAVILCYRRHRRGSTSFQTGAGEWAGPVPSPEEQAAVLSGDGVKEAGQGATGPFVAVTDPD